MLFLEKHFYIRAKFNIIEKATNQFTKAIYMGVHKLLLIIVSEELETFIWVFI